MKNYLLKHALFVAGLLATFYCHAQNTVTEIFDVPGTITWVVPACVTEITVQVYGGGGGGGGTSSKQSGTGSDYEACTGGGGGGGGGFASRTYTVVPGEVYTLAVGAGGAGGVGTDNDAVASRGQLGGESTFDGPSVVPFGILTGKGGVSGMGATANNTSGFNHIGDNGAGGAGGGGLNGSIVFHGGNGSQAYHSSSCADLSGAGGGGAGVGGNGNNGQQIGACPHTTAMSGGAGQPSGGKGGDGIKGAIIGSKDVKNGKPGSAYGGGGSGGNIHLNSWANQWQRTNGGDGANGAVIITYTSNAPTTPIPAIVQPTCTVQGSVTVSNPVAGATYTLTGVNPPVAAQSNGTGSFSGLNPGTYSITASQNGCDAVEQITINEPQANIQPTFSSISPVCVGETFTLPSTSLNGITGTWTPAINTNQTTQYTFTPDNGQCATTAQMTVGVTSSITPTFTQIPDVCVGSSFTLPPTSDNNITGSWSPAPNSNNSTQYTFTPNSGQCATTAQMTVNVTNSITPTFTQIPDVCVGSSFTLPPTSDNNITGSWSPAPNSNNSTQYTFTPNFGQCATTTQMTVGVTNSITPTFTQIPDVCVGSSFTLPTTSTNNITGSWSPAPNSNNSTQYTFTPNSGQCAITAQMTVGVTNSITPTFTQIPDVCVGSSFTLPTPSTNNITGSWSPAPNSSVSTQYTFTPDNGQCATTTQMTVTVTPSVTPVFTQIQPICSGGSFVLPVTSTNNIVGSWSPAENVTQTTTYTFTPTNSGCTLPTTMTVQVNQPTTPTFTLPTAICEGENVTLPTTSNESISGVWSPAFDPTQTATYTFMPTSGLCAVSSTITVVVSSVKATIVTTDETCVGSDGTATVTALGGTQPYQYQWSNGETSQTAIQLQAGNYQVVVTDANHCLTQQNVSIQGGGTVTVSDVVIPNILTANEDGVNDSFELPLLNNPCASMEVRILNRWGIEVFNITSDNAVFEGKDKNGKKLTEGIYFYQIHNDSIGCSTGSPKSNCTGFIHLIR